jgi:hypothetical protein
LGILPPAIRAPAAKVWRERIRPLTRNFDGQPDVLVIGAQKAGTTWLTHLFTQQPNLLKPKVKEVHYFNRHYDLGPRWYRSNFATSEEAAARVRETGVSRLLRYEATPDYLFHTDAPGRIAADLPNAKLIVLVRDPVWRALSGYSHMVRAGLEARSLEAAILGEDEELEQARRASPASHRHALEFHSYVARGHYFEQLERYRGRFADKDIRVLVYEEVINEPAAALANIAEFLDVPLTMPERTTAQNVGSYERKVDPKIEQHIRDATSADSAALFNWLGRPRPW